jgi:hypothetical protein
MLVELVAKRLARRNVLGKPQKHRGNRRRNRKDRMRICVEAFPNLNAVSVVDKRIDYE